MKNARFPSMEKLREPLMSNLRGFTLVEMMIAILIGLFLAGGLLTIVQTMKGTSLTQGNLSQMHDNERLAMRLMSDVIQATGDYPNPAVNSTANGAFPALTVGAYVFAKGQTMVGTGVGTAAAPGDVIGVRYTSLGGDGLTNCIGGQNPSLTVPMTFVNVFSIDANGNLQCQMTSVVNGVKAATVTATLVGGVTNMQIIYGMKTNFTNKLTSADTYLDAATINPMAPPAGYLFPWVNILSVQLTLFFNNPLAPNTPVPLMRVVNVMNQVGET